MASVEPEAVVGTDGADESVGKALKGKARKKALAAEKAKRRIELDKHDKLRAQQKAKEAE